MKLIHLIIIMIVSSIIFPQAMYVNDNNNYIGIMGTYESEDAPSESSTEMGVTGNYIFEGKMELGIGYSTVSIKDKNDSTYDMDGTALSFESGYYIKDSFPINVVLLGMYATASFTSDFLADNEFKVSGKVSGFGVEFYKSVIKQDNLELIPFVGIRKSTFSMKIEDSYGDSIEDDSKYDVFTFGIGINTSNLIIEPRILQSDGESDFTINVGFLISQK